ncbi:putative damage-inducible protein DinB [Ulvibacter sp. MAR_2010_11]|uniref:DinB family protein n=1 Tax=Ulvibacter sp. MAR_2010_11 TaxID=1250229 RepID=UPI000C2C7EA9|nr:DinB family protein [Ulvibacter sp. MAR_2010_11]PKA82065.1 putative damage-inducible protein DinB [Ulvibacter sp. MAR_2010_11]
MKDFFKDKFQYNFESNKRLIDCIENLPAAYTEHAQTLICHILNAHSVWNSRIMGKTTSRGVWDNYPIEVLSPLNKEHLADSLEILKNKNLNDLIQYTNTKGETYQNTVHDILYHIINHSTYHRGQLMSELKQNGVMPVSTDYIFFKR